MLQAEALSCCITEGRAIAVHGRNGDSWDAMGASGCELEQSGHIKECIFMDRLRRHRECESAYKEKSIFSNAESKLRLVQLIFARGCSERGKNGSLHAPAGPASVGEWDSLCATAMSSSSIAHSLRPASRLVDASRRRPVVSGIWRYAGRVVVAALVALLWAAEVAEANVRLGLDLGGALRQQQLVDEP
eukprot:4778106-Pleurochrysis_carterae.AAC.1